MNRNRLYLQSQDYIRENKRSLRKKNKEREREREINEIDFFLEREREREYLPMVDMDIKCDRERQILSVQEVLTHFM